MEVNAMDITPDQDLLIQSFRIYLKNEMGDAENTIQSYASRVKGYLKSLGYAGRNLKGVTKESVADFIEGQRGEGKCDVTIYYTVVAIKGFYSFLRDRGLVRSDPTKGLHLPRGKHRIPEPLTESEIKTFLRAPDSTAFPHLRDQAAFELLYATAMRVSELIGIELIHLDLENCWVRVTGKGNRERVLPFGLTCKKAIERYLAVRRERFPDSNGFLLLNSRGRKLSRAGFWGLIKRRARQNGIQGRVFPHRIRHSTATHLLSQGADIRALQGLLGHSSIVLTQLYCHVTPGYLKKTFETFHPRK